MVKHALAALALLASSLSIAALTGSGPAQAPDNGAADTPALRVEQLERHAA